MINLPADSSHGDDVWGARGIRFEHWKAWGICSKVANCLYGAEINWQSLAFA
jgi:hypothetical protein